MESGGDEIVGPPQAPCGSAYPSAFDACWANVNCAGFACFCSMEQCGREARLAVMSCRNQSYATPEDRQACYDALGMGP